MTARPKTILSNLVLNDDTEKSDGLVYTRYQSKCRISVGIKMALGKGNN